MGAEVGSEPFQVWLNSQHDSTPGLMRTEKVVIKNGPRVYKAASLRWFGDKETGDVSREDLVVASYRRSHDGPGYDFTRPEAQWSCEDSEIGRLQAILNREFPETGRYQLVGEASSVADVVSALADGSVDADVVARLVNAMASTPGAAEALAAVSGAALLASVIDRVRQQSVVERLRHAVLDPSTTETQLQRIIENEPWLFGSRYIRSADRRSFVVRDQLDIPLIRSDGALHVVEIKQANIPRLVVSHRNHLVVGSEVNEAVGQVMNYLRALDEQRSTILTELGVDTRRASATVVLGHPGFVRGGITSDDVTETIRTYNSHLARVEVLTYADLVDGAERSLALAGDPGQEPESADDAEATGRGYGYDPWTEDPPF